MEVLDDEVAITGISGAFPKSDNMEEFKNNLFENVDMISNDTERFNGILGTPKRIGLLNDITKFDNTFFGMASNQAQVTDCVIKLLLEKTFEAILDSGTNPNELRGKRTGVYVSNSVKEFSDIINRDVENMTFYNVVGTLPTMYANRISHFFDFKGPSMVVDTACSSSMTAIHLAIQAIRNGDIDAAIVASATIHLNPELPAMYMRHNIMSEDGVERPFDADANGIVRGEAAVSILLQKSKNARRIYAFVVQTGINSDGYKKTGISFPSGDIQKTLIQEVFTKSKIHPHEISYFEAHATGTKAGDPQEINAAADFFAQGRNSPLLIGSLKSSTGHAEAASALCSIAKIIIAIESGKIPATIHYKKPNTAIKGLLDGRLKVVDKNVKWEPGYVAVNSLGLGGCNGHAILKPNLKNKKPSQDKRRLVCLSGRTYEAVESILNYIENTNDHEMISLIDCIHRMPIDGYGFRGYSVLGGESKREVQNVEELKETWFLFSGMGAQWCGMGKDLMCLEPFSKAIHKFAVTLKPYVDVLSMINHPNDKTFDTLINSMVGTAAVQVGLLDVLSALGVKADKIFGHSAGEMICAYADGCLSIEETATSTYWKARAMVDSLKEGAMAAVGLTWDEANEKCSQNVRPACHNGENNVTISGPKEEVDAFVQKLTEEGIFARKVASNNYAFHHYEIVKEVEPLMMKYLDKIKPSERSERWLSTSIPEKQWGLPSSKIFSKEYLYNNAVSPVYFHEAVVKIPENSIVIEIAPHSLFNSVLKKSLPKSTSYIGLLHKGHKDQLGFLMESLGKIYNSGINLDLTLFHKPSTFPVARSTPMISPFVQWDHSVTWPLPDYKSTNSNGMQVTVDLKDQNWAFINGHNIGGRILFPATGYLTLVWKAFIKLKNADFQTTPIRFKNVNFSMAVVLQNDAPVKLLIKINEGSGNFEVTEGKELVASGQVFFDDGLKYPTNEQTEKNLWLEKGEIYKDLRLCGIFHQGVFQGVKKINVTGENAILEWNDNWIGFLDSCLALTMIKEQKRSIKFPMSISSLVIDPKMNAELTKNDEILAKYDIYTNIVRCGGVEVRGLRLVTPPGKTKSGPEPKIERYTFVPYNINETFRFEDALNLTLQLILENFSNKIKVVEIERDYLKEEILAKAILLETEPGCKVELTFCSRNVEKHKELNEMGIQVLKKGLEEGPVGDFNLVVTSGIFGSDQLIQNSINSISNRGFVMTFEEANCIIPSIKSVKIISKIVTTKGLLVLLRKLETSEMPEIVEIEQENWIENVKKRITDKKYIIASLKNPMSGILGFFNCLKKETENVRCIFIADDSEIDLSLERSHLEKDLMINVYKNGEWGSMRHILIDSKHVIQAVQHGYLNTLSTGDLSSLCWIESPLSVNRSHPGVCTVYYSAINFRDVMIASGKLSTDSLPTKIDGECLLGLEFSGRDSKGERVMGFVSSKGLATSVLADEFMTFRIPDKWTMEEATTVPAVYATTYFALLMRGKLRRGEKLLIHSGAGGVGQAAMRVAFNMGCEVFTTVGSEDKIQFLLDTFPNLKRENIGYSRDASFETLVMNRTKGKGVDIVLNSLAGELLQASLRCLGENGRFLEIGKVDMFKNSCIGMHVMKKGVEIHGILLDAVIEGGAESKKELASLITKGIESGVVQPLPRKTFHHTEIEHAFRYMSSGTHIGKIVLEIKKESEINEPQSVNAIRKTYMNPEKCYIVLGGLGGFGLELVDWILTRGAKNVVLVTRRGVKTGFQSLSLRRWKERGFNVFVSTGDSTTIEGAIKLLEDSNRIAPVGGIFNLAAVLSDGLFQNMTEKKFLEVSKPKVDITTNLDIASRKYTTLDHFVVFSSYASGRGNAGQSNYGYANSIVERICEARHSQGLPGIAIQWGAVGDVGMIFDQKIAKDNETVVAGLLPQKIDSCLATLDKLLLLPFPVMSSMVLPERKQEKMEGTKKIDQVIGNIMGIKDTKKIQDIAFSDIALDSLMTAEIKQVLERYFDIVVNTGEIKDLTFQKLIEMSASKA